MKNHFTFLVLAMLFSVTAWAQQKVTGTVTGEDGVPLIGVSVMEKGTSSGTSTDVDGKYSIEVASGATLVFSYTGYTTVETAVGAESTIDVSMKEGITTDEVIVTALGIEKSTKALTYSVTEVDPSSFSDARETNVVNSLAGKVAGVNVASTATGAGGSSRVIIRGNNSISGQNQPLYVVDGVPIDNTNLGAAGMWGGADGGDGISSINPNDIESITVLKGASAAALYGYRSANGVIEITTKSGANRKGIGVEFSSQIRTESVVNLFDFQNEYGMGSNGLVPQTEAEGLDFGLLSWGGRLGSGNAVHADGVSRPYTDAGDNLSRFYNTGLTHINTLTLTGGNADYNFRFSASNLDNEDVVPNSGLTRRNFTLRANAKLSEKLSATFSTMYINESTQNRPRLSDSPGNGNYTVAMLPANVNADDLKGTTDKWGANDAGEELQFNGNVYVTNPWWATYQFENNSLKNRLLGKMQLQYDIYKGLYARGKIGLDRYNNRTRNLTPYGTAYSTLGQINEGTREVQEINAELILGYEEDITDDIGINVFVGGNQQRNMDESISKSGSNFVIPFLHSVNNLANNSAGYGFASWQVNSIFGSGEVSFKRAVYLNATYRNDYFSTLTAPAGVGGDGQNNRGYYSVGASAVVSELVSLPKIIDFAKVRASYATGSGPGVANNPYQLSLTYQLFGQGHQGQPLGGISNGSVPNANLTLLQTAEFEAGFDVRLLDNLLALDFTYYDRTTSGDIINKPIAFTSGFGSGIDNIGIMSNKGVEVLLTANIINNQDFSWSMTFNYARNNNLVEFLLDEDTDDNDIRVDESRTRSGYIHNVEGLPYSQVAGFPYLRDNSGNIVYDATTGMPLRGDFTFFGTGVNPNTVGIGSQLRYKDLSFGFLIDVRTGGKIYSATDRYAYSNGKHKATLEGRDGGLTVNGVTQTGTDANGDPIYEDFSFTHYYVEDANAGQDATLDDYYGTIAGITEQFVQDAGFAKLRQMTLNYNVPKSIIGNKIGGLSLGVAARNLAILWRQTDNIDPESTYNVGNGQGLEMFGVPSTRSLQFNLNVRF